jgi:hypothetical protein
MKSILIFTLRFQICRRTGTDKCRGQDISQKVNTGKNGPLLTELLDKEAKAGGNGFQKKKIIHVLLFGTLEFT